MAQACAVCAAALVIHLIRTRPTSNQPVDSAQQSPEAAWARRAVQRAAPAPGNQLLQSLMLALPGLPDAPQLRSMASLLIGAYAQWLADTVRAGGPAELVSGSMRLLLSGARRITQVSDARSLLCCVPWPPAGRWRAAMADGLAAQQLADTVRAGGRARLAPASIRLLVSQARQRASKHLPAGRWCAAQTLPAQLGLVAQRG